MKLFEILNTKPDIKWTISNNEYSGKFIIDNNICIIQLAEYEVNNKSLCEFGFIVNGTHEALQSDKPAARIIGAVLNGAVPQLKALNPDYILIAIDKASGLVESRKSIYDSLHRWLCRSISFLNETEWIENSRAFYKIIGKNKIEQDEIDLFISQVKLK